jgi:uncharacterized protein YjiS (DUF1127 family)
MTAYLLDLYDSLKRWNMRRRTSLALERLDDHMLRDIGVMRGEIPAVAARQARRLVAAERIALDRRANQRARARERAFEASPRFRLALEQSSAAQRRSAIDRKPGIIVDDVALGAFFRGEPCHGC